jgi:WD40 repeat protein
MSRIALALATLTLFGFSIVQTGSTAPQASFPSPDFLLGDKDPKAQKTGVVLGPAQSDGKGGSKGSFTVYGGGLPREVSSLSFSGDGKLLVVGSTPAIVYLWDVEGKKRLFSLEGGTAVGLSLDGRILAIDGKGIELYDVASHALKLRIPRTLKRPDNVVNNLAFNFDGTLLLVTANGDEDTVFEVSSGRLVATLQNTQHSQFSRDSSLVVGGNAKHLIVWNTKDWSKASDSPNGPDYVRRIAAFPEKDIAVVGGPNDARLVRLSSGTELAKVGAGWANFTSFNQAGTLIFTYVGDAFAVWDVDGKQHCSRQHLANGTVALSPGDRWLAAAPVGGGTTVAVWEVQKILTACGL